MVDSHRDELREELATGTRILGRHDLIGMFGHVSLLTDDPGRYLICPGAGQRKDVCRPDELHELGLDDEFRPGLPLELYIHAAMHRAQPEVTSLIHVHSPNLTALAAMAEPPGELLMMHASFWPEQIPVWEQPELVRDHETAEHLVDMMGDSALALMRWHGAIVIGRTVREAVFRALLAERHAGLLLASLAHGRTLSTLEARREALYSAVLPSPTHDMHWSFGSSYVRLDDLAADADDGARR